MKFKSFALLALIALIFGCNNPNLDEQRELDLKEKELDLKEKELLLKQEDNKILKGNSFSFKSSSLCLSKLGLLHPKIKAINANKANYLNFIL